MNISPSISKMNIPNVNYTEIKEKQFIQRINCLNFQSTINLLKKLKPEEKISVDGFFFSYNVVQETIIIEKNDIFLNINTSIKIEFENKSVLSIYCSNEFNNDKVLMNFTIF
ncbi:MAG: hypothetical protein Q8K60_00770 [Parachlamydiaceae bacterium]|nr:hypothetical protein [Parachlamydiaceae bacterium]